MGLNFESGTGLEELQRAMLVHLHANVDGILDELNEKWKPLDEELSETLELEHVDSPCEHIAVFSDGHRPSFIEAPIDNYPNVSVMAYRAEPAPEQWDQGDTFSDTVYVELLVKSPTFSEEEQDSKTDAESIVNRRVQRTADAVQRAVADDPTLGGSSYTLQAPPTVDITDVFVRRESVKTGGDKWLWQAARLEWKSTKYSSF